jgi:glycerol kinase
MIDSAEEIETLALKVPDNGGVFLHLSGLAHHIGINTPRCNLGNTRGTTNAHIARALEGIAYQVYDLKLWKLILARNRTTG